MTPLIPDLIPEVGLFIPAHIPDPFVRIDGVKPSIWPLCVLLEIEDKKFYLLAEV